jgi:hypothetical protein
LGVHGVRTLPAAAAAARARGPAATRDGARIDLHSIDVPARAPTARYVDVERECVSYTLTDALARRVYAIRYIRDQLKDGFLAVKRPARGK